MVRAYHSNAVLLPNATVLVSGGGLPGPTHNLNSEIYYPPYLFASENNTVSLAARPTLASISARKLDYDTTMNVELQQATTLSSAVLIALGSSTHSFDQNQRRVPLEITQNGNLVGLQMPASANLAPPGYYSVFLLDEQQVPPPLG